MVLVTHCLRDTRWSNNSVLVLNLVIRRRLSRTHKLIAQDVDWIFSIAQTVTIETKWRQRNWWYFRVSKCYYYFSAFVITSYSKQHVSFRKGSTYDSNSINTEGNTKRDEIKKMNMKNEFIGWRGEIGRKTRREKNDRRNKIL